MAMAVTASDAIDELDLIILTHLQQDGRKSFTDIAQATGASVGTIRNRVQRMVEDKTVRISGRVDPHRVGFQAPANIRISVQPASQIESVAAQIAQFPEVSYVALMSGEFDLEIDVMCRDQEHLSPLITERLHKVAGVSNIHTDIVLRVYKLADPDLSLVKGSD
jgi:Lrp/AsnC family transcriptional regulator for asnA, asnC and gidA